MSVAEALDGVDGLLLTGGDDVAPARYGEHAASGGRGRRRRSATSSRSRWCARRGSASLPIFAICRGLQVLNVACGGTLVQDIPSQVTGRARHKLEVPPHQPFDARARNLAREGFAAGALMRERLSDADSCEVNSRHHQAVKQLAPGFNVVGDGARRRHRGDRRSRRPLLPRRPVAPGELLAHRRIPAAVRRIPGSHQPKKTVATGFSRTARRPPKGRTLRRAPTLAAHLESGENADARAGLGRHHREVHRDVDARRRGTSCRRRRRAPRRPA